VKTVITCPISKATLCADFMARETQRRRPIHRDCRYFQHVDRRIVWNFPQDPRLLWKQTKSLILKIRAGYDIAFNCIQQVPMLLMLSVHPSRRSDLLSDDRIEFSPKVRARDFKDAFGNICSRLVAPTGLLEVRNEFTIADSGEPDIKCATDAAQWPIDALPDDSLIYLLGGRYCDTQKLSDFALVHVWARRRRLGASAGDMPIRS
jgi:hypothetical protein